MPAPTQPSEIAREVLRLFAARRISPTPDNFRALYYEVAGTPDADGAFPDKFVRALARQLPRDTAERVRIARQLDQALADSNQDTSRQALTDYLASLKTEQPPAWNELIANLLKQWEARQLGWTTARKRESLERVLAANDPATLHARLHALVRSWTQAPGDPEAPAPREPSDAANAPANAPSAGAPTPPAGVAPEMRQIASGEAGELLAARQELLQLALETVLPPLLTEQPELAQEADRLAGSVKAAGNSDDLRNIAARMRKFAYRLEMVAGDRAEINAGLLNLLRLLLDNIDQIVVDDSWLSGQIEVLRDVLGKPANVRLIDDAERRLREIIYKQSQLKHNHSEAQRSLKELLAGFVDHLASFAETTGAYHDRIGNCADRISTARDITEISGVLGEVMRETLTMRDAARRSRDDLVATRERARDAEERMNELQRQLDEASRLMRHDQLTGVLNRRGLEETFDKEAARARRHGSPLSLALLDLDNFKQLNDTFGHRTGDDALVHLATIIRQSLRPQDTISRHGGEEFILLYPDTTLEQAQTALVRLQRELTRNFFLTHERKVLITFSAGVTQWNPDDTVESTVQRADEAMYQAKQAGKNKVVAHPVV
ncbi:diguanylate cyclase [Azoarcus sp. CIB]|uniref:GGDEF domain-containing protein n=1 Tax=Aromatoleum sp. (strain CIB) TaxID=198107 RepID=UPI00067E3773|nr:GGDEF domain-containing protein [Azoarcus sp. CIB]AKU10886.1 diguanylate cyclase [Azoarcus sp. CIB]